MFHIFTHAFFKCCLFLCAGSVSHSGSHHSFDMKKDMGGLAQEDADHVRRAGSSSTLALCGVPFFCGLLLEGRDHRQRRPQRLHGVLRRRPRRRVHDRRVHDPRDVPHVLRRAARCRRRAAPRRRTIAAYAHGEEHALDVIEEHEHDPRSRSSAAAEAAGDDAAGDDHAGHARPRRATPHGAHDEHRRPARVAVAHHCARWSILATLAFASGYLNAAPFGTENFKEWVEPRRASSSPSTRSPTPPRTVPPVSSAPRVRCRRYRRARPPRAVPACGFEDPADGDCFPGPRPRRVQVGQGAAVDPARRRSASLVSLCAVPGVYGERKNPSARASPQRNRLAACRPPLPGQQVLPRRPVREGHRPRHRPPDRQGGVLGQPERHRRHRQRRRLGRHGDRRAGSTATSTSGWSTARSTASGVAATEAGHALRPSSPARSTSTARCCSAPPPSAPLVLVIVNV